MYRQRGRKAVAVLSASGDVKRLALFDYAYTIPDSMIVVNRVVCIVIHIEQNTLDKPYKIARITVNMTIKDLQKQGYTYTAAYNFILGKAEPKYWLIRQAIKKRDDFACQWTEKCNGTKYYSLQVHHIDGDITNNTQSNLITLCRSCHQYFHHLVQYDKVNGYIFV